MSIQQNILEKFPLGHILFILASGTLTFLLLPYEIFGDNLINSLRDVSNYTSVFEFFATGFCPFGNISYLATKDALVFTKIIVTILIIGVFFLLTRGIFSFITGKLWKYARARMGFSNKTEKTPKETEEETIFSIKFAYWARKKGIKPYTDFIWSLREITLGLLYASEFLCGSLIIVLLPIWFFVFSKLASWFGMLIFSLFSLLFSSLLYYYTKKRHEKEREVFFKIFRDKNTRKFFDKY